MANDFELLFDLYRDPIVILHMDGKFRNVNRSFVQTLGWSSIELMEMNFWEILTLGKHMNLDNIRQNLSNGHPVFFIDCLVKCKSSEPRQFRWTAYPNQETQTIALTFSEPGTHKNEHEMFQLAAEASPTVILVVADSRIRYANRFIELVFGYSKAELIGEPVEVLIPAQMRPAHHAHQSEYLNAPYLRLMGNSMALTGLRKNGQEFPVDIGLNPVQTSGGSVVVCSIIDLTKRKESEEITSNRILQLENRISTLDKLSKTDALTEIKNRRALDLQLELHYHIAQKSGRTLSFIILDIDNFKHYNDSFGHLAGDEVLKFVAKLITMNLRRSEIIARYGGEEFGIILPENNTEGVMQTAERLRKAIEEFECPFQRITVSMGCATLRPKMSLFDSHEEINDLIRMADRALYYSKRSGKNQVTHFDQLMVDPDAKVSDWKIRYQTPPEH